MRCVPEFLTFRFVSYLDNTSLFPENTKNKKSPSITGLNKLVAWARFELATFGLLARKRINEIPLPIYISGPRKLLWG